MRLANFAYTEISDVGTSLEFRTVEPILIHVKYARQLRTIEQNSPQVAGHLPELWRAFIARDFNADPYKYVPADQKKWDMVYAVRLESVLEPTYFRESLHFAHLPFSIYRNMPRNTR